MIITKGTTTPLGRTVRLGGILLCAAILSLVIAGSASAANFCVGDDVTGGCPGGSTPQASLPAAITASISNGTGTTDFIYVASGTYSSASGFDFGTSRVRVKGVGATPPVITLSAGASTGDVISTGEPLAQFENLEITLPSDQTGATGFKILAGGVTVKDVSVSGTDGIGFYATGQNPGFTRVKTTLSGADSVGLRLDGAASTTIDDSEFTAHDAVDVNESQGFLIKRITAYSARGLQVARSNGTISSSLLAPNPTTAMNAGGQGIYVRADSVASNVRADNVTVIGESGQSGVQSRVTGSQPSTVTLNSSLIMGFTDALMSYQSGAGAATLTAQYSRYQGLLNDIGGGTISSTSSAVTNNPGFITGTYRLSLASSLVDAGDPGALDPTDSASDLAGNPRVVSRGAGNVRDIGAYEVQNSTPEPVITILTPSPSTTAAVQFSAAGSSDAEGDPITFDWKFDGTSFAVGATASKLFNTEGPHVVQLTATDKTGAGKTVSRQFNVAKGFLTLALKSQNAHLTASGDFSIKITCPATAATDCTGRLLFQTVKKISANQFYVKPSKKKSKPKTISAANHVFRVEPGTTATAKVRAYRTFRNVLKKYKNIKIQSTLISGSTANAVLTAPRATFTISAPKKKKS